MVRDSEKRISEPPPLLNQEHDLKLNCPRCDYGLQGTVRAWKNDCPLKSQCPECGLTISWGDLFNHKVLPGWYLEASRGFLSGFLNAWGVPSHPHHTGQNSHGHIKPLGHRVCWHRTCYIPHCWDPRWYSKRLCMILCSRTSTCMPSVTNSRFLRAAPLRCLSCLRTSAGWCMKLFRRARLCASAWD